MIRESVCVYPCVTLEFTHARQASDDALSLRKTWIILIHVTSGLPLPRHLPHSPVCVFRGCGCVATGGSSLSGTTCAEFDVVGLQGSRPRLIVCKQTPTKTTFRARGQRLPRTVSHLVIIHPPFTHASAPKGAPPFNTPRAIHTHALVLRV